MKRLAIQFFGHLRTYEKTHQKFFENVVIPNQQEGWEIDLFIHTWDTMSQRDKGYWHQGLEEWFDVRDCTDEDKRRVQQIYQPKKFAMETLQEGQRGAVISRKRGEELRLMYEQESGLHYDYILYTRPDILFCAPLRISTYIDCYTTNEPLVSGGGLPEKHCFTANNFFGRMPVADPTCLCEWDLVFFRNHWEAFNIDTLFSLSEVRWISIDYQLYNDFMIMRKNGILGQPQKKVKIDGGAVALVHSDLAYQLGQVLILNSKHCLGYLRMPLFLISVWKMYQLKQKHIKHSKLPSLESFPDYEKALKERQCLTYKLGEAFIKATKNWYKGGFLRFYFQEVPKLKREFRKKD